MFFVNPMDTYMYVYICFFNIGPPLNFPGRVTGNNNPRGNIN
jgi:hypothetical protein